MDKGSARTRHLLKAYGRATTKPKGNRLGNGGNGGEEPDGCGKYSNGMDGYTVINHAETGGNPPPPNPPLLLCTFCPAYSANYFCREIKTISLNSSGAQSVFALGLGSRAFHSTVPATAAAQGATQYTKNHCASMVTLLSYTA